MLQMSTITCDIQCRLKYHRRFDVLLFTSQKTLFKTVLKYINIIYLEQWHLPAKWKKQALVSSGKIKVIIIFKDTMVLKYE